MPDIKAPIVFIGGNHEDYAYVEHCRQIDDPGISDARIRAIGGADHCPMIPVERSGLIWYLPPGQVMTAPGVNIAGLSGIDAEADGRDPKRYHSSAVLTEDNLLESAIQLLDELDGTPIDFFLTHDGVTDFAESGKRSSRLADVLRDLRHLRTLTQKHVGLTQLRDNLVHRMSFLRHLKESFPGLQP